MTKKERDEMDGLRFELDRAQKMEARYHDHVVRSDEAIEGLMRDVLAEVIGPYSSANSIASARLIAAVAKASAKYHGENVHFGER